MSNSKLASIKYRTNNLEKCRERSRLSERKFRIEQPENCMLRAARKRSKQIGIEFSILKEDIEIPSVCPVLGIPIYKSENYSTDNSPSLDRIDNSLGYIKGNVKVISQRANMIKSNGTAEEHEAIANYIRINSTKLDEQYN